MKEFYRLLKILKESNHEPMALATVIGVKGSAYRHAGAKMLFRADGRQYGTISAGCLEEDLFYHAKDAIESQLSKNFTYDLSAEDDLSWGQGAGCNGEVQVYVEPILWNSLWEQVAAVLDAGHRIVWAKSIEGKEKRNYSLLYSDAGNWKSGNVNQTSEDILMPHIKKFMDSESKFLWTQVHELECDFIFEMVEPKDRLYIFGAGPDVEPLVDLAEKMDFAATVIDPRSSRCNSQHFPSAHKLVVEHPESYLKTFSIPRNSYVLIMTHNFTRDRNVFADLLKVKPKYLGLLGPRKRSERLAAPDSLPDWVYSPVGLEIGAEGPEEISVSIVSQLIQVRNERRIRTKRNDKWKQRKAELQKRSN